MKKPTLKLLRSLNPCYDPAEIGFKDGLKLSIPELIDKFKSKVKSKDDIIWVLCRSEFMSDKDMRLFAVWCARESFKLVDKVDNRSINACDIAEKYANGDATKEELNAAGAATRADDADAAAWAAAWVAARAAWAAARAAGADARAADAAAWAAQIEQLKTYFKK